MLERLFSTHQIADLLGADHEAVVGWIEKGWLPVKHLPDGPDRISEKGLVRFLMDRGVDIKAIMAKVATSEGQPPPGEESAAASPLTEPDTPLPVEPDINIVIDEILPKFVPEPGESPVQETSSVSEKSSAPEEFPSPSAPPSPFPVAGEDIVPPADQPADPAAQVAGAMLRDAVARRVSHIHLDSVPDGLSLRVRIDGVLYDRTNFRSRLPNALAPRLIEHFKRLAGLGTAETARPQKGRFRFTVEGRETDFRLAACPTVHGERLVIHVIDSEAGALTLSQLGFAKEELSLLRVILDGRCGIILVAGPPGSGRSTTLRAMLAEVNTPGRSLIALEKSGATRIEGVSRIRVDEDFTSTDALRALVDQDADVIMAEDITDGAAISTAVKAALNGRLILGGLFARNTSTALEMMLECGRRWSLASALPAVISQRTVRKICPECRREATPSADLLDSMNLRPEDVNFPVYEGGRCDACSRTGYMGRTGLFSLLHVDGATAALLRGGADVEEIELSAGRAGMKTLRQAGLEKVRAGITSLEEIARVFPSAIQ